jgi:hypothetical protein
MSIESTYAAEIVRQKLDTSLSRSIPKTFACALEIGAYAGYSVHPSSWVKCVVDHIHFNRMFLGCLRIFTGVQAVAAEGSPVRIPVPGSYQPPTTS